MAATICTALLLVSEAGAAPVSLEIVNEAGTPQARADVYYDQNSGGDMTPYWRDEFTRVPQLMGIRG